MKNNLLRKFMEFGIGSIFTLLIGFISSPIITRIISPEQNGKYSMFNTITNLFMIIFILGLDQAYVRFYYEEKEDNRGELLRRCIKIPIIINIFAATIILLFYKPISNYIVQESSLLVGILLVVNLFVATINRFIMLQVRMQQKAKLYSLLNILIKSFNIIFIILFFIIFKDNYITLILAWILANIIVTIIAFRSARDELKKVGDKKLGSSKTEILKYGIPLVFSMAITWIFQSIDRITIKEFSGYEEVGLYAGAMTIISLLNAVQNTFTTFWTPVAFEKYKNNPDDVDFFKKISDLVTIMMMIIAVGLIASKDLIVLLLGKEYREAVFIFPFLVFMPVMYTISETTVMGINFKKKPKLHMYIAILVAMSNLIGNLMLVPSLGARGAAISTGISYMIFFVARTYFSKKLYNVNYSIKNIIISNMIIYLLAIYSSFNEFDVVILILSGISVLCILILYNKVVLDIYNTIKKKIKR